MANKSRKPKIDIAPPTSDERLTELWRARDYAGLLVEPLPPLGIAMVDGQSFTDIVPELVRDCPRELQVQNPIAMLRFAYVLYSADKRQEAGALMQNIRADIVSMDDEKKRDQLMGEWMFITALSHYPNIEKMLDAIEQANELSNGSVTVLDANEPFIFQTASPYATFHVTPGKAERQGEQFACFAALYEKLTGGGGRGSAELYQAALCYYRGDFKQAGLLCYKSAYLAESKRQAAIHMGAGRFLALIGIHNMDMDAFSRGAEVMERAAASRPEYGAWMEQSLEFERTDLYFEVSVTDHAPKWVQDGELKIFPAAAQHSLKYWQMRYFFYSGKHEQCIGLGEALLKHWQDCGVLVKATIGMYSAFSYFQLGYQEQGMELFKQSFPPLFKDKLYLIFTYYYESMDGVLDEYLMQEYPNDADAIFQQIEKNRQGRTRFMRTYLDETNSLTKKEREVAELAAQGMQNKEIAEQMGVSVSTVRTHLRRVFTKLDISRRSEIIKRLK